MSPDDRLQLALAALREGRADEAAAAFEAILAAAPRHLGALASLAGLRHRQGRLEAAEAGYRQALAIQPGHPLVVANLGVLLTDTDRHEAAVALADAVLAATPGHVAALILRGGALTALGRFTEAVAALEAAAASGERRVEALTKLGAALAGAGRRAAALAALDEALALAPEDPPARLRRALVRLQGGDFAGGWDDYEGRWTLESFLRSSASMVSPALARRLDRPAGAEAVDGRRVLLVGEQGLGDQVMFASMAPDLLARAAAVTLVCDPRLVRLFSASFPQARVAGPAEAQVRTADIDLVLAMGSLGRLFRRTAADFPRTSYLQPGAAARAAWARRLGPRAHRLRVGLSWRGGAPSTRRSARSLTLPQLAPILDQPDVEFVSLQYGDVAGELAAANAGRRTPIRALAPEDLHDFDDLTGLMSQLDLVVSVQTAAVHLAGGLGLPCLTLVPQNAEWRYGADGPEMAWYGSVRLFRQTRPGGWGDVIGQAAQALAAFTAKSGGSAP